MEKKKIRIKFSKPKRENDERKIPRAEIAPVEIIINRDYGNSGLKLEMHEMKETDKEKKLKFNTVPFPDVDFSFHYTLPDVSDYEVINFRLSYPLIPRTAKSIDEAIAFADIHWDDKTEEMVYFLHEPKLDDIDKHALGQISKLLEEKLEIEASQPAIKNSREFLKMKINEVFNEMGIVDGNRRTKYMYYLINNFVGYGKLEALMADPHLEDISCDGVGIPVYVYHRNQVLGSIRTNIIFSSEEELDNFVLKLAEKAGKTISVSNPLLDEALPDGSRVQLTLGTDIASKGSNFTIRKFTENPFTPLDLIRTGVIDIPISVYLWFLVEHNSSIIISGGTGTGKTTMLNALSLFIKPQLKVVSIEDTPELKLPHPHWVPEIARVSKMNELGKVDMFDLLKESLRQRPDFIIVGEVRGKEASVLFQQIATGHAGMATIHADSFEKLVDRMITPPINLSPSLLENLDAIVFLKRIKYHRIYIRRTSMIHEVIRFDRSSSMPVTNVSASWMADTDSYSHNNSYLLWKSIKSYGMTERELQREFEDRAKVMEWMLNKNISDYREFARIVNMYYNKKDLLMVEIDES